MEIYPSYDDVTPIGFVWWHGHVGKEHCQESLYWRLGYQIPPVVREAILQTSKQEGKNKINLCLQFRMKFFVQASGIVHLSPSLGIPGDLTYAEIQVVQLLIWLIL